MEAQEKDKTEKGIIEELYFNGFKRYTYNPNGSDYSCMYCDKHFNYDDTITHRDYCMWKHIEKLGKTY